MNNNPTASHTQIVDSSVWCACPTCYHKLPIYKQSIMISSTLVASLKDNFSAYKLYTSKDLYFRHKVKGITEYAGERTSIIVASDCITSRPIITRKEGIYQLDMFGDMVTVGYITMDEDICPLVLFGDAPIELQNGCKVKYNDGCVAVVDIPYIWWRFQNNEENIF